MSKPKRITSGLRVALLIVPAGGRARGLAGWLAGRVRVTKPANLARRAFEE